MADQILAESRAFASRTRDPPPSAAVLGANLLNAARVDFRHSSPLFKARKRPNGKLSRPSWGSDRPPKKLARRGDEYELQESPDKGSFKLPETVNKQPLRIVRKRDKTPQETVNGQQQYSSEASEPVAEDSDTAAGAHEQPKEQDVDQETEPVNGGHDIGLEDEASVPSSPPGFAPTHMVNDVEIELRFSNGRARCTMLSYSNNSKKDVGYYQCARPEIEKTIHGSRCLRHLHKPGHVPCEHMTSQDTGISQCPSPAMVGKKRCSKHAISEAHVDESPQIQQQDDQEAEPLSGLHHKSRTASNRKSEDIDEAEERPPKVLKGKRHMLAQSTDQVAASDTTTTRRTRARGTAKISIPIPVRQGRKQPSDTEAIVSEGLTEGQDEPVAKSIEMDVTLPAALRKSTRFKTDVTRNTKPATNGPRPVQQPSTGSASISSSMPIGRASEAHETEDAGADGEQVLEDEEVEAEAASTQTARRPGTLEQVFAFLDFDERSGRCQTELGINIKRVCDNAITLLDNNELTIEKVNETADDIRKILKRAYKVDEDDRPGFKCDAYAYVFRSLTHLLDALHHWLHGRSEDLTGSLQAMRLLSPLINDILAFKDIIAFWQVTVPQRYQGDRIIKDVDMNLITPLREVASTFHMKLSRLESKERSREKLAELDRQAEEQEAQASRREKALAARKERWKVWQELHIKRMQCEPDPRARRKLVITKLDDPEETDANGVPFERLPIFKNRVTPPTRAASSKSVEVAWTDAQMTALLDGLRKYAGMSCLR